MKKTLIALAFALAALPFAGDAAANCMVQRPPRSTHLPCTTCHATKDEMPTTDTCIKCHPKDKLVASTKNVKPTNPHTSPHYNADLDCVNCHVGHEPSENDSAQCQNFDFKVP